MKKIINGRKYDTETAKKVGEWEESVGVSDFSWYEEELYKKRTGEFFLYGCGNAASKYAEHAYGAWQGGSAITPLTYEQARQWAEESLDADDYEAIFGEVSEDDAQATLYVRMPAALKRSLDTRAAQNGEPTAQLVTRVLQEWASAN